MLDGLQMIYLDRVESDWPLQYRLKIGSHVPLHCTASGKLFLSLAPASLRKTLYQSGSLERHTPRTITDPAQLEAALEKIRKTGIGTDNEEFIDGMTATSVAVRDSKGNACAAIAVHGPVNRLPFSRAMALVPALKKAASAIEKTFLAPAATPVSAKKQRNA
jgi:DNA-binding IclR family transcriptional regulator